MGAAKQIQVVVVDDNEDIRGFVSVALELDGRFEIAASVATASAAIREIARLRPDGVLLDLTLPDVEADRGVDVVTAIRELVPRSVLVVFTGRADDRLEERVLAAGGTALVTKGDSPSAFIDALAGAPRLEPGASVVVRSTFSGEWQPGFFVSGESASGYWLRRGDGSALPVPVDRRRVRPESSATRP